jgi:hypothetical protein
MAKGNRNGAEREMVRQIVWLFQCLPCNFLVYLKSCIDANVAKTCIKRKKEKANKVFNTRLLSAKLAIHTI